jgi:hypothetical protein
VARIGASPRLEQRLTIRRQGGRQKISRARGALSAGEPPIDAWQPSVARRLPRRAARRSTTRLADGPPPKLDALWNAYREGAARHGLSVPPREEVQYVLDCFYLHKILKALSESVSWHFPVTTVAKFVMLAEETAGVAR